MKTYMNRSLSGTRVKCPSCAKRIKLLHKILEAQDAQNRAVLTNDDLGDMDRIAKIQLDIFGGFVGKA